MADSSKHYKLIIQLLDAGSNVIVKDNKASARLLEIAQAAARNKVHATFLNCQGNPTKNLLKAEAGGKYVTFEV